jgi:hypothetical protein
VTQDAGESACVHSRARMCMCVHMCVCVRARVCLFVCVHRPKRRSRNIDTIVNPHPEKFAFTVLVQSLAVQRIMVNMCRRTPTSNVSSVNDTLLPVKSQVCS